MSLRQDLDVHIKPKVRVEETKIQLFGVHRKTFFFLLDCGETLKVKNPAAVYNLLHSNYTFLFKK